jgi:hypothetical protein
MGANSHRWLEPALRWQSMAASFAVAGVVVIAASGLHFSLLFQIGVLLAGIVLVGFPHGAFDHLVARPVSHLALAVSGGGPSAYAISAWRVLSCCPGRSHRS